MSPLPSASPTRSVGLPHFPALVLVLGEPTPGSLADRVRQHVGRELGPESGVSVLDLGDLRREGLLEQDGRVPQTGAMRRWLAKVVLARFGMHTGQLPSNAPILPCVVVCDGEQATGRTLALSLPSVLRSLGDVIALPADLEPRVAMLVAWPTRWGLAERAPLAAWSRDLAWLARERSLMDGVFIVARASHRSAGAEPRMWSSDPERDEAISQQVLAMVTTGLLDEAAAMRRGVDRTGLMALGVAEPGTSRSTPPAQPRSGGERAISREVVVDADRVAGSDSIARATHHEAAPRVRLDPAARTGSDPVEVTFASGSVADRNQGENSSTTWTDAPGARDLVIRCLVDISVDQLPGVRQWMRAYHPLERETRVGLHRFAGALVEDRTRLPPPRIEARGDELTP